MIEWIRVVAFYWVSLDFTWFYQVFLVVRWFYRVLPSFTHSSWILLGFTGFYRCWSRFTEFSLALSVFKGSTRRSRCLNFISLITFVNSFFFSQSLVAVSFGCCTFLLCSISNCAEYWATAIRRAHRPETRASADGLRWASRRPLPHLHHNRTAVGSDADACCPSSSSPIGRVCLCVCVCLCVSVCVCVRFFVLPVPEAFTEFSFWFHRVLFGADFFFRFRSLLGCAGWAESIPKRKLHQQVLGFFFF